ncbi:MULTISPECIES: hypothetical protein [Pseudoalteromonas]|uniref:Uncharacterized protein n=1 Tax=Pseudoalteromonas obscura TaxID=3048491 RepID=A0ABT7EE81_9GAMM|nr:MULTISPECIES: hypothetical protein [Pseudoalteromonas]MBQ4838545.1 hypothetical protein [Pseudoalteromonas luteoviolacea]MDK2593588.1 hypothetical protein [Pseudoalteromonas sp. P94(2023)]
MTPDLEKRWKAGDKPFDGEILTSATDSSMETLLKVMKYFMDMVVDPSEKIFLYDDWHEHDGFITNSKILSVDVLKSKINSSEALKASTHGDYEVRTAVYSESNNWLMRWCIDLEDDAYCDFEFCISKSANCKPLELMHSINRDELNRTNAKDYFDRAYGG